MSDEKDQEKGQEESQEEGQEKDREDQSQLDDPIPDTYTRLRAEGLNDRMIAFIDEYILHNCNATRAAIAAGYAGGASANVRGCLLLKNPVIRAEIDNRLRAEHMDTVELLRLIARDARGVFGEFIKGGELDLQSMEEAGATHLIDQIVPTKYGTSYKGPSRQRAQEMLIKILGLQRTEHILSGEVKITGSLDERLQQVADLLTGAGTSEATPQQD